MCSQNSPQLTMLMRALEIILFQSFPSFFFTYREILEVLVCSVAVYNYFNSVLVF